jgi:hypothetical protein
LCTGEVGEGPVVESSVELAVHKAAGRVEVFPGPVVATGARGAQETDKTRREVRAGGAQETQGVIDNVVAGVIDNAVAGVIDNAVAGVIDNAVGKVDEGVKSRETYRQIVCQTAGGAETTIEAVSEASGRRSQIILGADAEQADKAVELVDPDVTEPFIENLEDPEVAKNREKYHQIVCRIAGGAGTIIEAVSEASGRRSQDILEADAEEPPDEVIAAKADKAVQLVDPEEVKSRKSIINSIIERRAKKPNYTCG